MKDKVIQYRYMSVYLISAAILVLVIVCIIWMIIHPLDNIIGSLSTFVYFLIFGIFLADVVLHTLSFSYYIKILSEGK